MQCIKPKDTMIELELYQALPPDELLARARAAKEKLGADVVILGHNYQRDDVISLADYTGDSFELSRNAARCEQARAIVFCGVHFMAETAAMLCAPGQSVILPDMTAGCPMADMADLPQVESAWQQLGEVLDLAEVVPITYMDSTASLKAFCGRHNGAICTSSNARGILTWALGQRRQILFFPDQHLGRNTAKRLDISRENMVVWKRDEPLGGNSPDALRQATLILWDGYCGVHTSFTPADVEYWRRKDPSMKILVHPECTEEVVDLSDLVGSTSYIIDVVTHAPPGSRWAIGTEINLVTRLKNQHPKQFISVLSPLKCLCGTMYQINLYNLTWVLENLVEGHGVNPILVDPEITHWARIALDRMLSIHT